LLATTSQQSRPKSEKGLNSHSQSRQSSHQKVEKKKRKRSRLSIYNGEFGWLAYSSTAAAVLLTKWESFIFYLKKKTGWTAAAGQ
jgi:hypothetical protein